MRPVVMGWGASHALQVRVVLPGESAAAVGEPTASMSAVGIDGASPQVIVTANDDRKAPGPAAAPMSMSNPGQAWPGPRWPSSASRPT
jgi:hypothetical protein